MKNIAIVEAPKKVRNWQGCHVISHRPFSTMYLNFPKGTVFLVRWAAAVKRLESLPCGCCGISANLDIKAGRDEFLTDFSFVEIQ